MALLCHWIEASLSQKRNSEAISACRHFCRVTKISDCHNWRHLRWFGVDVSLHQRSQSLVQVEKVGRQIYVLQQVLNCPIGKVVFTRPLERLVLTVKRCHRITATKGTKLCSSWRRNQVRLLLFKVVPPSLIITYTPPPHWMDPLAG